jgi:hypothetical protein
MNYNKRDLDPLTENEEHNMDEDTESSIDNEGSVSGSQ